MQGCQVSGLHPQTHQGAQGVDACIKGQALPGAPDVWNQCPSLLKLPPPTCHHLRQTPSPELEPRRESLHLHIIMEQSSASFTLACLSHKVFATCKHGVVVFIKHMPNSVTLFVLAPPPKLYVSPCPPVRLAARPWQWHREVSPSKKLCPVGCTCELKRGRPALSDPCRVMRCRTM